MTPLSLLWEFPLLRTTTPPLATWDALLPDQATRLPDELAKIDAYLDDESFIAAWRAHFHARLGRPVPHPTTLSKLVRRAGPGVIDQLNHALLGKLAGDKLLGGRKLRVDTTVVEADIDYPTDADLLEQAVRKAGGLVRRIKAQDAASRTAFRDRGRAAGRRLRQLAYSLRRRGGQAMAEVDRLTAQVARIASQTVHQAQVVARNARRALGRRPADGRLGRLVGELDETISNAYRLLWQTEQRLAGNRVIPDRLVSLADLDARPIRKGKPQHPTQFGYTLLVAEDERGFVADHQLQQGNPPDGPQLVPSVERVANRTGRVAATVVGDRGFGTAANDRALAELGVRRIGLQRKGTVSAARAQLERTRAFRRLRNWRVGIEARISHLKRGFGLRRTRLRRLPGAKTWVGLGVFAYNLQRMTVLAAG